MDKSIREHGEYHSFINIDDMTGAISIKQGELYAQIAYKYSLSSTAYLTIRRWQILTVSKQSLIIILSIFPDSIVINLLNSNPSYIHDIYGHNDISRIAIGKEHIVYVIYRKKTYEIYRVKRGDIVLLPEYLYYLYRRIYREWDIVLPVPEVPRLPHINRLNRSYPTDMDIIAYT